MDIDGLAASYMVERLIDARLVRRPNVPNPSAGAEVLFTVPTGVLWEVMSLRLIFISSAVVANRVVGIHATDADGIELWRLQASNVQAAGVTGRYTFLSGLGATTGVDAFTVPLPAPPFPLAPNTIVTTITTLLDVGDQYTGIQLQVRELAPDRIAEQVRRLENDVSGLFGRFDFEADDDR